jgi:hypothetical protein
MPDTPTSNKSHEAIEWRRTFSLDPAGTVDAAVCVLRWLRFASPCQLRMPASDALGHYRAGNAWRFVEKAVAVRYAAARHAAFGNVVEVVRWTDAGTAVHLVLPPDTSEARAWPTTP